MDRKDKAEALFKSGCNCAQAVACAFADAVGMDEKTLAKASSSFGGGFARLREVCGAFSGICLIAGLLYGTDTESDQTDKKKHYEFIRKLADEFEKENGSIICRELLGLTEKRQEPTPEARTEQYYQKRPCSEIVRIAVEILEKEIR